MSSTHEVLKIEPSSATLATAEENILLDPEDLYSRAVVHLKHTHGLTLEDATSGNFPAHLSGHRADETLPSTVRRERTTGIFPPATPGEIQHQQLRNKAQKHNKADKFKKLLATGTLTLSDTKGYRIRAAYRLLRQMARVRGILTGYDMLQNVMSIRVGDTGVDQWALPQKVIHSGFLTGMRGVRNILLKTETGRDRYTFNTGDGYRGFKGVTTLPPPIPDHLIPSKTPEGIWGWRLSRAVPDGYSVGEDMPLILYCEAMTILSEQVGIHHGAPQEPWSGEYGLAGLLNPTIARIAWPTRDELVMYEEELMLLIYDKLAQMSVRSTEQYMQDYFGYTRFESLDIVKTAKSVGPLLYTESAEVEKTILIKQIDNVAEKCDLANDPRAELSTLKLKAQLYGLTANETHEGMEALRDAAISGAKYEEEEDG